jgi:Predicted glycosyltransferases
MQQSFTVIIPTYKPGQTFLRLLKAIGEQSVQPQQIIVMNTDSSFWNPIFDKVSSKIKVVQITKDEFDHGGTRDAAAQMADTDILLYITQDVTLKDSDVFATMLQYFNRQDVKAVYARQLPEQDCKTIESYTRSFNYPDKPVIKSKADLGKLGIKTYFCSNVCAAYDRETYLELGGFAKRTIFNEDMIYAGHLIQAGYRIAYAANACVIHSHNYSDMEQLRRNFDLAVSQVENPDVFGGVKAEGEGIRLVKQTAKYLWQIKKPWLIIKLFITSIFKYKGYWLGKHYKMLPKSLIMKLTMNKSFWDA